VDGHAFVTRSTFKRLAGREIELVASPPIEAVFAALFHRNLAEILSHPEALQAYSIKLLMERQFAMVRVGKRSFSREYIFKVAPPRFHSHDGCEYLQADFQNYKVPEEIKRLGDDKIREFQQFCNDNRTLLRSDDAAKFWRHVGAHFRVHIKSVVEVRYANSGVQGLGELTVVQLRERINALVDEAIAILQDDALGRRVRERRYASTKERALAGLHELDAKAAVNRLFELKRQIVDALLEMYFKQAGATGFLLPEEILRQAGLEPCRGCSIAEPVAIEWGK